MHLGGHGRQIHRPSLLYFTCGTLEFLNNLVANNNNPTLTALIQLLSPANSSQNCNVDLPK